MSHSVGRARRRGEVGEVAADVGERRAVAADRVQRAVAGDVDVEPAQPARVEVDRERHGDRRAAVQIEAVGDRARIERRAVGRARHHAGEAVAQPIERDGVVAEHAP